MIGAFIPVVLPMGATIGSLVVVAATMFAAVSFFVGGREGKDSSTAVVAGEGDGVLTDEDLRPSQPSPPSGTDELASRLDSTSIIPVDETTALPADPTIREGENVARPTPPTPSAGTAQPVPWYLDQLSPTVSSVEGVEVDDGRPVPPGFLPPSEPRDDR